MPRTRKSLVRFVAVGVIASALAFGAAAPAFAFGPAEVTVTPSTTGEDPATTISAVCPVGSVSLNITWTGTDGGAPASYGPTAKVLDGAGNYSEAGYSLESFFDRDTDVTFSIDCLDAGAVSTGTASTVYHLPTTAAVTTAPASFASNADIIATGNCGTAVSITALTVNAIQRPLGALIAGFPITVPYTNAADFSVNVGSADDLAVPVGDSVQVQVLCVTSAPAPHTTSVRSATTLITLAVAPPVTTPSAGPALAATGSDAPASLLAAGSLLLAGAVLVAVRRRRGSRLAARRG